ncbi:MAG: hypothetical protein ACYCYF_12435, partial [Anaerolineae bacterium]
LFRLGVAIGGRSGAGEGLHEGMVPEKATTGPPASTPAPEQAALLCRGVPSPRRVRRLASAASRVRARRVVSAAAFTRDAG